MKKYFLIITLIFCNYKSFSQTAQFSDGVYLDFKTLNERMPAYDDHLIIKKNKKFSGTNDYFFLSDNKKLNKKFLDKKVYACVTKDSLFINCQLQNLNQNYSLVITKGNFLVFCCAKSIYRIEGHRDIDIGKQRILYVLSLSTGRIKVLDEDYINLLNKAL
jgi:hypothetical protein